jgi:SAM-dependent methyltransferase
MMLNKWFDKIGHKLFAVGLLRASWDDVLKAKEPKLYAGNIDRTLPQFSTHYGITPFLSSSRDIRHDLREALPIPNDSIAVFQSEDVFEHIEYATVGKIFDEVFRVLRPGGLFRLSVPDYRCPILLDRSVKDADGNILFDPGGGGRFENGQVVDGGHVWFPVYETVKSLFDASSFRDVRYLHYTDRDGQSVLNPIDYTLGNVQRTPDNDERVASPRMAMSIVVDARK